MTGTLLDRPAAVGRARALNRFSLAWNVTEAGLALAAGIAAGSISLVGFGLDSVVEVSASVALAWRLAQEGKGCTQPDDRRATRLVALSFGALAVYVAVEATRDLIDGHHPEASAIGVALAVASLLVMPWLARAKRQPWLPCSAPRPRPPRRTRPRCARCCRPCSSSGWSPTPPSDGGGPTRWPRSGSRRWPLRAAVTTWRAESLADTCCH